MALKTWLDEKEPPPGGLAHLRNKISDTERPERIPRRLLFWPAGFAAALLVWWLIPVRSDKPVPELLDSSHLIALGAQTPPARSPSLELPRGDAGVGLVKVLETERVVYYQIVRPTIAGR